MATNQSAVPSGNAAPRPEILHPETIPGELKAIPRWLLWRLEDRAGKPTKTPYQVSGALAKVNDPATWTTFENALTAYLRSGWSGIGIVLTEDDDLVGVDLDKVLDPDTGELAPEASRIVADLPTYCEVSPSGRGLRLFGFGKLPQGGRRKGHVEMYEAGRYLTVTGNQFNGHGLLAEITPQLTQVHARIFGAGKAGAGSNPVDAKPGPMDPPNLDDADLLDKARRARNGADFERLWAGDASAHGGDESAADLALCNLLSFWTSNDAARIDRLFRQSGLMRPKWDKRHHADGRTYGQATIEKALEGNRETYGGHKATQAGDKAKANSAPALVFEVCGDLAHARIVCIATDRASGQAIFDATHCPTVIAGSPGRLWKKAQELRAANPKQKILVCGDAADPATAEKTKIAAFSLVGGSHWCNPDFLKPGRQELQDAAIALMKSPPAADDPIPVHLFKEAAKTLSARDQQRVAEESPSTFADLAGWSAGMERLKQQIDAAAARIGVIKIQPGKLPSIVDRAEKETRFYGAGFYQRVGMLVRPVKQDVSTEGEGVRLPAGALVLNPVDLPWLNRRFSQAAKWENFDKRAGTWNPADPPTKYAETYLSLAGEWKVPVLTGIVECPTLRRDGSLLTTPGYDPVSGLYLDYTGDAVDVPEQPTRAEALAALAILKEPFAEFPFAEGEVDLSVVLAGLLTTIVRRSLRTAPLFAFDAPTMGSGKGLIVDSIATIATGRTAPAISQGKDETEDEKRLGALLLRGVPMLNIDNIERPLEGDLLCSILTQTAISIRILGKSEVCDMPSNLALFATGNNIRAKGDMVRRVLICRIDPACERPDTRTFKRNLTTFIPENRAKLLSAALTVLRAYIVAGKPVQDIPPYGSFEEWSGLVRSALVWLGMPDPNLTRARLESEDPVSTALHCIFALWNEAFGKAGMTAAEIVRDAENGHHNLQTALLEVAASRKDPTKVDALRLGHWLRRYKGKVANWLRLEKAGDDTHSKMVYWRIVPIMPPKSAGDAGIAGIGSHSPRAKCQPTQRVLECHFLDDGLKQYPQSPASPANPQPAEPPPADDLTSHHPPSVDSKNSANSAHSGERKPAVVATADILPPGASGDARQLWEILKHYRGAETAARLARKLGWNEGRVIMAAQELSDFGRARISGDCISPIHPPVRSSGNGESF